MSGLDFLVPLELSVELLVSNACSFRCQLINHTPPHRGSFRFLGLKKKWIYTESDQVVLRFSVKKVDVHRKNICNGVLF